MLKHNSTQLNCHIQYIISCNIYCIIYHTSYIRYTIYLMCVEPNGAECWLVTYDSSYIYCVSYIICYVWYSISYISYVCRTGRCRVLVCGSWLFKYDTHILYHVTYIVSHMYHISYIKYIIHLMCVEPDGAECWCAGAGLSNMLHISCIM